MMAKKFKMAQNSSAHNYLSRPLVHSRKLFVRTAFAQLKFPFLTAPGFPSMAIPLLHTTNHFYRRFLKRDAHRNNY